MASYEVQVSSPDGWQIVAVFPVYDSAFDYARELDRKGRYYELRIQKEIQDSRTGLYRESTIYRGGLKAQTEKQQEAERLQKETVQRKREYRRTRKLMARLQKVEARAKERLHVQTRPLYVVVLMSMLFLLGMGTMYYFDHVLLSPY